MCGYTGSPPLFSSPAQLTWHKHISEYGKERKSWKIIFGYEKQISASIIFYMFEDLSEKYTDVLSMQPPQFTGILQKANASMDSSGKQSEEQGQHPTWTQPTMLMAWQQCHIQDLGVLYLKHNQKGTMDVSLLL